MRRSCAGPGAPGVVGFGHDLHPAAAPMLLNLRLSVPPELAGPVEDLLGDDPRVATMTVLPGASRVPVGDVVLVDVPREAVSEILDALEDLGLGESGAVSVTEVAGAPFRGAHRAEHRSSGLGGTEPDDHVTATNENQKTRAGGPGLFDFSAAFVRLDRMDRPAVERPSAAGDDLTEEREHAVADLVDRPLDHPDGPGIGRVRDIVERQGHRRLTETLGLGGPAFAPCLGRAGGHLAMSRRQPDERPRP